jgi:hypothetical protein
MAINNRAEIIQINIRLPIKNQYWSLIIIIEFHNITEESIFKKGEISRKQLNHHSQN